MKKLNKSRDQLLQRTADAYERGASIRSLVATTGRSYGPVHSMLRESGTTMRSRGGPNHRTRRQLGLANRRFDEVEYGAELFGVVSRGQPCDQAIEHQVKVGVQHFTWHVVA